MPIVFSSIKSLRLKTLHDILHVSLFKMVHFSESDVTHLFMYSIGVLEDMTCCGCMLDFLHVFIYMQVS